MKTFYLSPINGRKSFNHKCEVIVTTENNETISKLKSYDTIVAEYNHNTNVMRVNGWYSTTTARHINAFLDYYGFNTCTKKELINYKN